MLAIIQARLDSKRFPKKVLFNIYNDAIINRVYSRVKKAKKVTKVVVSIPATKDNDELEKFCKRKKMLFYRGSKNNVALRMVKTAERFKFNSFIRISGDSPLIDPDIIDYAIKIYNKNRNIDVVTNSFKRSCPSGQSVEVINLFSLKKILKENINKDEKEHVTKFFYNNSKNYKICNFKFKRIKYKNFKFSIDSIKDLKKILLKFNENQINNLKLIKK